jgi:hypothetical protein
MAKVSMVNRELKRQKNGEEVRGQARGTQGDHQKPDGI